MHVFIMFLLLLAPTAQRPTDIVRWSAVAPKSSAAGSVAKIELTAKIEEGWKLYALTQPKGGPVALEIALEKGTPFVLVQKQITGPLPKVQRDDTFKVDTQYYEHEASFTVPVTVPKAVSGKSQLPLDVTFQACGAEICLRPFTQRLNVELIVGR
jgi:DsbC/DsbD-like thiol-disulfide interchange protein